MMNHAHHWTQYDVDSACCILMYSQRGRKSNQSLTLMTWAAWVHTWFTVRIVGQTSMLDFFVSSAEYHASEISSVLHINFTCCNMLNTIELYTAMIK
jgi:hypothetical protein